MTKNNVFGDYFRDLRRSSGFKSQKLLAEASGISQATISRIEDGSQIPQEETLKVFAPIFDVSLTELLFRAGHIRIEEVNANFAGVNQGTSISNFLKKATEKNIINNGKLIESVREDLRNYIKNNELSGFSADTFIEDMSTFYELILETLKNGGDTEGCLQKYNDLMRAQKYLFYKYLSNNQLHNAILNLVDLLIGDREHDFLGSIEQAISERIGDLMEKHNIATDTKITIHDHKGVRRDIPEQYSDFILSFENPQFQWEALQVLQDIAHEFHIKWNSAYEVGARQPKPKKLEEIIQHTNITYNGILLEDKDRQRILDMLEILFRDR